MPGQGSVTRKVTTNAGSEGEKSDGRVQWENKMEKLCPASREKG